jgi:hypothetical protein
MHEPKIQLTRLNLTFCIHNCGPSIQSTGADTGGAHPARALPKIGKNMIFLA